jgi:hypothetical protein
METQTLTTGQVFALLGLLAFTFTLLYNIGKGEAKRTHKVYGSAIYARLCMFADFVNKCGITLENYNNIQYELTIIKELKEMEDCVFKHKVDEIVKNFERRFKQWIPISDQLTPTN